MKQIVTAPKISWDHLISPYHTIMNGAILSMVFTSSQNQFIVNEIKLLYAKLIKELFCILLYTNKKYSRQPYAFKWLASLWAKAIVLSRVKKSDIFHTASKQKHGWADGLPDKKSDKWTERRSGQPFHREMKIKIAKYRLVHHRRKPSYHILPYLLCSLHAGDKVDCRGDFWVNGFFHFHDHLAQRSHGWVEGLWGAARDFANCYSFYKKLKKGQFKGKLKKKIFFMWI